MFEIDKMGNLLTNNCSISCKATAIWTIILLLILGGIYASVHNFNTRKNVVAVVIFLVLMASLVYLLMAKNNENYIFKGKDLLEITPAKTCRGGPYMFQGDSPTARRCQKMWGTAQGRDKLQRVLCLNGDYQKDSGYVTGEKILPGTLPPNNPWGDGLYPNNFQLGFHYTPDTAFDWSNPHDCVGQMLSYKTRIKELLENKILS